LLGRAVGWFWDLPGIIRLLVGVTLVLILLVPLSRITLVASALTFGVSAVVLAVRVARRGPVGRWGIVAAASLVIALASYGTYNAMHSNAEVDLNKPLDGPVLYYCTEEDEPRGCPYYEYVATSPLRDPETGKEFTLAIVEVFWVASVVRDRPMRRRNSCGDYIFCL